MFNKPASIITILAAVLLIAFYLRPAIGDISELQDEIFVFKDNADKISEVNTRLNQLASDMDSLRQSDMLALETYLPDQVDSLQVMYDIETLAQLSNLNVISLSSVATEDQEALAEELQFEGDTEAASSSVRLNENTNSTDFSLTAAGSYTSLKAFLERVTNNYYPLDIVSLEFETPEEGPIQYQFTIRTYNFNYSHNR